MGQSFAKIGSKTAAKVRYEKLDENYNDHFLLQTGQPYLTVDLGYNYFRHRCNNHALGSLLVVRDTCSEVTVLANKSPN